MMTDDDIPISRFNCNYKVKGMKDCVICNPIKPCNDSSICDECLLWLQKEENESPASS